MPEIVRPKVYQLDDICFTEQFEERKTWWYFTAREFGELRGCINAVMWIFGIKWSFKEKDNDKSTVHWDNFKEFLNARSTDLKRQNMTETSFARTIILAELKRFKKENETV
jgi:hypothetical protein